MAGVFATWLMPTTVVAQHAKEEPAAHTAASAKGSAEHAAAPAKASAAEHAATTTKHEPAEEPARKPSAKSAEKEPTKATERGSVKAEIKHSVIPELDEVPTKTDLHSKKETAAAKEGGHPEKGHAPTTSEHASISKEHESATGGGTKGASAASTHGKVAPKSELQAALARIDEQMANKHTSAPAPRSPEVRVTSETRTRVTPTSAPTRVHLNWRTTLVWSDDLEDVDSKRRDAPRVGLVWTPPEPLASTPIRPTATR